MAQRTESCVTQAPNQPLSCLDNSKVLYVQYVSVRRGNEMAEKCWVAGFL
jgi:hypothetical protein